MSSDDCNKYLDININNLLFKNYDIKNLLFSDIDYTFEKQKDGFITRDVNIIKPALSSYSEIKVEKVWSSPLNSKIQMINFGICCSTTSIVMRQGSNSSHVSFKELGKISVSLIV